jgi:hypothetical protein
MTDALRKPDFADAAAAEIVAYVKESGAILTSGLKRRDIAAILRRHAVEKPGPRGNDPGTGDSNGQWSRHQAQARPRPKAHPGPRGKAR